MLAGGFVGDGDGSCEQILDTHETHIAIAERKEKAPAEADAH